MDFKQLEYFVRVAELGSFTRASIELNIAQPALSRQIRTLELEFQKHLFIRNGRGVSLTEAGTLLLEHGRGILHQVTRTKEELNRADGGLNGRVVLGIPPSLLKSLAVPLTRAFHAQLPHVSLSISEGLSVTMQESLVSGRLDLALLYNITPSPEVETIPLLEEELFLIEPAQDKQNKQSINVRDLVNIPLIIPGRPHSLRMLIETELANIGAKPRIALEINSVSAILALVADNQGSAILSKNALASFGTGYNFYMRPIVNPSLNSRLMLASSLRRPSTLIQQTLTRMIQDNIVNWLRLSR